MSEGRNSQTVTGREKKAALAVCSTDLLEILFIFLGPPSWGLERSINGEGYSLAFLAIKLKPTPLSPSVYLKRNSQNAPAFWARPCLKLRCGFNFRG